jgi:hypothetical protein
MAKLERFTKSHEEFPEEWQNLAGRVLFAGHGVSTGIPGGPRLPAPVEPSNTTNRAPKFQSSCSPTDGR